jgi:Histidine phosphatase superfamily (branch 1)
MKRDLYPSVETIDEKYPGGESLLDLLERSKKAITQLVLPHLWKAAKEGSTDTHVAVVGHGLCLQAIMYELLLMSSNQTTVPGNIKSYDDLDICVPLYNAAWTRVVINIEVRVLEQLVIQKLTRTGRIGKPVNRRGSAPTSGYAYDRC